MVRAEGAHIHVRDGCADGGQRLPLPKVRLHLELLLPVLLEQVHVHCQVLEVPSERACKPPQPALLSFSSPISCGCQAAAPSCSSRRVQITPEGRAPWSTSMTPSCQNTPPAAAVHTSRCLVGKWHLMRDGSLDHQ